MCSSFCIEWFGFFISFFNYSLNDISFYLDFELLQIKHNRIVAITEFSLCLFWLRNWLKCILSWVLGKTLALAIFFFVLWLYGVWRAKTLGLPNVSASNSHEIHSHAFPKTSFIISLVGWFTSKKFTIKNLQTSCQT